MLIQLAMAVSDEPKSDNGLENAATCCRLSISLSFDFITDKQIDLSRPVHGRYVVTRSLS